MEFRLIATASQGLRLENADRSPTEDDHLGLIVTALVASSSGGWDDSWWQGAQRLIGQTRSGRDRFAAGPSIKRSVHQNPPGRDQLQQKIEVADVCGQNDEPQLLRLKEQQAILEGTKL